MTKTPASDNSGKEWFAFSYHSQEGMAAHVTAAEAGDTETDRNSVQTRIRVGMAFQDLSQWPASATNFHSIQ